MRFASCKTRMKARKKNAEPEIFRQWVCTRIKRKLPVKTLSDHYLQVKDIAQLVYFCWGEKVQFYKECPSMAVEGRFARIRGKNPKRKPSRNDGRDLQHGIVSPPVIVMKIISGDGYLRECMRYVSKQLSDLKLAKVHDSFDSFLSQCLLKRWPVTTRWSGFCERVSAICTEGPTVDDPVLYPCRSLTGYLFRKPNPH